MHVLLNKHKADLPSFNMQVRLKPCNNGFMRRLSLQLQYSGILLCWVGGGLK